jgi:hypothetical protein
MPGEHGRHERRGLPRPLGHEAEQLVAHGARREVGEHGAELGQDGVDPLGGSQIAPLELALDPKAHERDALVHQAPDLGRPAGERHVGGVLARRQRDDPQLQPPPGRHSRGTEHRALAGGVGVEREQDLRRQARELPDLLVRERRPHEPHGVAQPRLVERDDVRVALAEHDAPRPCRVRPRDVGAEDVAPFVEDRVVGRVEVLGLLVGPERSRAEAQDPPAAVAEWEDDPPAEPVDHPAGGLRPLARGPRRRTRAPRSPPACSPSTRRRSATARTRRGTSAAPPPPARARPGTPARAPPRPSPTGNGRRTWPSARAARAGAPDAGGARRPAGPRPPARAGRRSGRPGTRAPRRSPAPPSPART